jgi:hypothetical protein
MTQPDVAHVVDARAREARLDHPLRETATQVGIGGRYVRERHFHGVSEPAFWDVQLSATVAGVGSEQGRVWNDAFCPRSF